MKYNKDNITLDRLYRYGLGNTQVFAVNKNDFAIKDDEGEIYGYYYLIENKHTFSENLFQKLI